MMRRIVGEQSDTGRTLSYSGPVAYSIVTSGKKHSWLGRVALLELFVRCLRQGVCVCACPSSPHLLLLKAKKGRSEEGTTC